MSVAGIVKPSNGADVMAPDHPDVARTVQAVLSEAFQLGASKVLVLPVKGQMNVVFQVREMPRVRDDLAAELFYPVIVSLMTMTNLSGNIKIQTGKKERQIGAAFRTTRYGVAAVLSIPQDTSRAEVFRAKAAQIGFEFIDLESVAIPKSILGLLPEKIVREHEVVPVTLDGDILVVAMSEPQNAEALDRLRLVVNRPLAAAMAAPDAILAAIHEYYGPPKIESSNVILLELAQPVSDSQIRLANLPQLGSIATSPLSKPFIEYLRMVYRNPMLEMFDEIRRSGALCRKEDATGDLEPVLPHSEVIDQLPATYQRHLEDKVWALRESAISQLEGLLARSAAARRLAMSYAMYLACGELSERKLVSVNPAPARDAWINFLYAWIIRSFPSVQSHGALLKLLGEQSGEVSDKLASLLQDPEMVVEPGLTDDWLARFERQTITCEPIDGGSPIIAHLVELLIAEAVHARASRLLVLPHEGRVEVAYRVQCANYARDSLPLRFLFPILARLRLLADVSGRYRTRVGGSERAFQVGFFPTPAGPMAWLDDIRDQVQEDACRKEAVQLGCEFLDLEEVRVPDSLLRQIPQAIAWQKRFLPLSLDGNELKIALSTAPDARRLARLRLLFHRRIAVALATEDDLLAAVYRHYHASEGEGAPSPLAAALLAQQPARFGEVLCGETAPTGRKMDQSPAAP